MKVKVIKSAELESLGQQPEHVPRQRKRRRMARAVEKWVADIRKKTEAEERMSFEHLFHTNEESSS